MSTALSVLAFLVMLGVLAVLAFGFLNMVRGGSGNRSQQLMRLRVLLQAVAVLVIVGALWFAR